MLIFINLCPLFLECYPEHQKRVGWSKSILPKVPLPGEKFLPSKTSGPMPLVGDTLYLFMLFGKLCSSYLIFFNLLIHSNNYLTVRQEVLL